MVDSAAYTVRLLLFSVAVPAKFPKSLPCPMKTFLWRVKNEQTFGIFFSDPFPWKGAMDETKHSVMISLIYRMRS